MKIIEEFKSIIPPPKEIYVRNGDQEWLTVFKAFGTRLPEEFLQFHKSYGDGYFFSLSHKMSANISIFGSNNLKQNSFLFSVPEKMNELRQIKAKSPKKIPFPLFWEPRGLLPWGCGTNGSVFCWITDGDLVDNWETVIIRPPSGDYQHYNLTMIELLIKVISGEIECSLLPKGFPGKKGVAYEGWLYGTATIS
jgi:hypothetical protein